MPKIVDHAQRRDEIVAALWRIVRREGLPAATVRHVAAEAGLSPGALRYYFPSQAELVDLAMRECESRARDRIARIDPADSALDRVTSLVEQVLPLDQERREEMQVWAAMSASASYDPATLAVSARAYDGLVELCRSAVAELQLAGLATPDLDLDVEVARLHGLIDGLALHLLLHPERLTATRCREVVRAHLGQLAG